MSTYRAYTKHPVLKRYMPAWWIDDHFKQHHYGVKFDGSLDVYDPEKVKLPVKAFPPNYDFSMKSALAELGSIYTQPPKNLNAIQPSTPKLYLGVDNGKHGGLAVIDEANDVVELIPMPVYGTTTLEIDVQGIVSVFEKYGQDLKMVTLESVFTMPATSRGVCQMLGRMLGLVEGITASRGIPYKIASPKEWQSKMFAYMSYPDTKTASITVAKRLQPNIDWNHGEKKPHDGLTDAYCLAVFGKQLMYA